jgi:transposase
MKRYKVTLTDAERHELQALIASGKAAARKLTHARILLKADASPGGPAWIDQRIVEALEVGVATVERVRQRFVEEGLEAALGRKPQQRPRRQPKLDGQAEARLIALACSAPPQGRKHWTLRLLADRLVELEMVEAISDETGRRVLKKNEIKPWLKEQWCIPAVLGPAAGIEPRAAPRSPGLGEGAERTSGRGTLALHHSGCPHQASSTLPITSIVMVYLSPATRRTSFAGFSPRERVRISWPVRAFQSSTALSSLVWAIMLPSPRKQALRIALV